MKCADTSKATDPLHAVITGSPIQRAKARETLAQLLTPVDEGKNEHKRAQLRELAEINGTIWFCLVQSLTRSGTLRSFDCSRQSKRLDNTVEEQYEQFLCE